MIVSYKEVDGRGSFTQGKHYPVLSLYLDMGKPMMIQVVCDDGTPVFVEANRLNVEDAIVPESWITLLKTDYCRSGYPEILNADIMERYFEGDDEEALEAVKRAVRQASIDTGIDILSISSYSAPIG